jgi:hypothetical protein
MASRKNNTTTFFIPKAALASSVNEILSEFGLEETWQSITVTRQAASGGSSATRVTIDYLGT